AARILETGWGPEVARHPEYRRALVETAVFVNAAETAFQLGRELAAHGDSAVEVAFGVYDLATQRVGPPGAQGDPGSACLTLAPQGPDDFLHLEESLLRSDRLREALGEPTGAG